MSLACMAAGIERGAETRLDFAHGLQYLSPPAIAWSHGLAMSLAWSLLAGVIAYLFTRRRRASAAIGLMPLSHWLLDFTVYRSMPLLFDNATASGLGLIASPPGLILGILLEVALIGGGIAVYWITRRRNTVRVRGSD